MYLFYDHETSGLNVKGVPADDPRQPSIVSLNAILDDAQGVTRAVMSAIIKQHRPIEPGAMAIHGITDELAEQYGIPLADAMGRFDEMAEHASIFCAHNHFFDWKMLKIACSQARRLDLRMKWQAQKRFVCTMNAAARHFGKGIMIKQNVAFERLFERPLVGLHQGHMDCRSVRGLFYKLRDAGADLSSRPIPEGSMKNDEDDFCPSDPRGPGRTGGDVARHDPEPEDPDALVERVMAGKPAPKRGKPAAIG